MKMEKQHSVQNYLEESLKEPGFRKIWEDMQPEYQLSCAVVRRRALLKMARKDLARKAHTSLSWISRIENMNANPSYEFMQRIAGALDAQLVIDFK